MSIFVQKVMFPITHPLAMAVGITYPSNVLLEIALNIEICTENHVWNPNPLVVEGGSEFPKNMQMWIFHAIQSRRICFGT